jgi:hypothetical protein
MNTQKTLNPLGIMNTQKTLNTLSIMSTQNTLNPQNKLNMMKTPYTQDRLNTLTPTEHNAQVLRVEISTAELNRVIGIMFTNSADIGNIRYSSICFSGSPLQC